MSTRTSNPITAHPIRTGLAGVAALALAGGTLVGSTALADDHEDDDDNGPDPIAVEMLTPRAEYTDDVATQITFTFEGADETVVDVEDASHVAVAEITIQPGAVFPWHTHPGPVLITIAEGDFVYVLATDCVERAYTAGQALIDAGGDNVHSAYNPSDEYETVVVATFLGAPDEGPLTVPVDDPDDCPLPTP